MKKAFWIILLFILTFQSYQTLLRPGYFSMHDDMQAMRVLQMKKCISDFQIPCRWVPDMGYGYGYPQFNYYGPLPYYVIYIFTALGFGILTSVKIGFILTIFVSLIGMFLLGSYLFGAMGGFLSALFFVYSPYRAVDMYVRGAVGEFWALSFLPFVFLYSKKIIDQQDKSSFYLLSIFLSFIFLSHNITTVIILPVLFLWIALLVVNKYFSGSLNFKIILNIAVSLINGFFLSAFFVLPAFLEKKYVHIETMLSGYFDYRRHFVSISQLLFRNFWGFGGSELGPFDEFSFNIGLLHWLIPTFAFLIVFAVYKNIKNKQQLIYFLFFYFVGWFAFFMTHSKSSFVWNQLSIFKYFQFPWRYLTLATFSFSLSIGFVVNLFFNKKNRNVFVYVIIFLLFLFNLNFFRTKDWLDINDQDKFSGKNWELQQTISIFDYLPKSAKYPPVTKAPENLISNDEYQILSFDKKSNKQIWNIEVKNDYSEISLPIYHFPGWKVYLNNKKVDIYPKGDLGLITFKVNNGYYEVYAILKNTNIRLISNMISLFSVLFIFFYYKKFIKND